MGKIRVAVLFGGKSAEHEVALQSARNVVQAIDPHSYEVILIGIDKQGHWRLASSSRFLADADDPRRIRLLEDAEEVTLPPWAPGRLLCLGSGREIPLDVVFPVLHGPFGEDGTVQGLLRLAGLPFVGSGVLASSLCMDKEVSKRLLRAAGIPVADFLVMKSGEPVDLEGVRERLGLPLFVKPANLGSSVGVSKVKRMEGLEAALQMAFQYDRKVVLEQYIPGRELECAVLGNQDPLISVVGEIVPSHEFYSYEAKYLDDEGARLEIPARLEEQTADRVRELALQAFRVLECEGMARVDFFLRQDGEVFVNELNTIPGFTRISMYPKLLEASGISYQELVERLIRLALERHREEARLKTSYDLPC